MCLRNTRKFGFHFTCAAMKVSGFSFIKNALIYDFPIVEAITSILPICDEFIVAVGDSDDDTLDLIAQIEPGESKNNPDPLG
jgi:hypothetical protein